jgi:hypothetical protein
LSGSANHHRAPNPGNPEAGHDFPLGMCTPCHVVSPKGRNRQSTSPMLPISMLSQLRPNPLLSGRIPGLQTRIRRCRTSFSIPQEAADVIAYILSLSQQHSGFERSQTDGRNKVVL